jgi:RES domain-containing protein
LELQDVGTHWATAGKTVCLRVPSAVVPGEHNFLLNPRHGDFGRLRIGKPEPFEFDQRLVETR